MKEANKALGELRASMKEKGIDIYIIPTADYHMSEYVGEYFKSRQFLTGFTGSAGTAVVMQNEAYLWTDGRYFIQAASQLKGSGFSLVKMGEEGAPTIAKFLKDNLKSDDVLGFDGRCISIRQAMKYKEIAKEAKASIEVGCDLIDNIWQNRPKRPEGKVFILEDKYSGCASTDKIALLREEIKKCGAYAHVLSSLYDIAWLLNIRGNDIKHVPVTLSYMYISMDDIVLYINKNVLNDELQSYLQKLNVLIRDYNEIYEDLKGLEGIDILMDKDNANCYLAQCASSANIIYHANPTQKLKAIKNETEIKNTIKAHIKDGVVMTKFMYYLKNNIGKIPMSELTQAQSLDKLRSKQEGFIDISFDTISAYGENAAMMHYQANENTNKELEPKGFYLVDSGGHYLEGTTDVTRTFCLGEISDIQKRHFTAVLKSNISLARAKFLYGCRGSNLDILAREPLWSMSLDYKCGTGHGVGHILNVHEGPNAFRWRISEEAASQGMLDAVLEEGMITTNEPGVYLEGEYGIRTENEMLCKKAEKNIQGQFMEFEVITYVPIDLDAIDADMLSDEEKDYLNDYHKKVRQIISPYLSDEENEWLKRYTRAI